MLVLSLAGFYLSCGVVFAVPFLLRWIHVVDESTHDTSWIFRLAILPGTIVFWPFLLKRCITMRNHD